MTEVKEHEVVRKPRGKSVYRKSSVNAPAIGISPSTKHLIEENERIVSAYGGSVKAKRRIQVVINDK